jgi:hypothetical protein
MHNFKLLLTLAAVILSSVSSALIRLEDATGCQKSMKSQVSRMFKGQVCGRMTFGVVARDLNFDQYVMTPIDMKGVNAIEELAKPAVDFLYLKVSDELWV